MKSLLFSVCLFFLLSINAFSQSTSTTPLRTTPKADTSLYSEPSVFYSTPPNSIQQTSFEFYAVILVAVLVLVLIIILTIVILRSNEGLTERYYKLVAIVLITGLATMMTFGGFSQEQAGSAMGLLGTIAGYLLGRSANINDKNKDDSEKSV